jgi:predicted lipoprotein with Yx(FWY)xxD motif
VTVFISSGRARARTIQPMGTAGNIVAEHDQTVERFSPRIVGIVVALSLAVGGALAVAPAASGAPAKATGTKIALRHSPNGRVLAGAARKYVFVHVKANGHNAGCNTVCRSIWPMAKTSGKPRAGKGVKARRLRQTSGHQVTYFKRPLFYYAPSPQDPSIAGAQSFGGTWHLISAKGKLR